MLFVLENEYELKCGKLSSFPELLKHEHHFVKLNLSEDVI